MFLRSLRFSHLLILGSLLRLFLLLFGLWQDYQATEASLSPGSPPGVRYTDVDYDVFSDGAAHVAQSWFARKDDVDLLEAWPQWILNTSKVERKDWWYLINDVDDERRDPQFPLYGSPYARATFRYTPLLAWVMVPNVVIHPVIGKLILIACDVFVCIALYRLIFWRVSGRIISWTSVFDKDKDKVALFWATWGSMLAWYWNPMSLAMSTRGSAESLVCALLMCTLDQVFLKRNVRLGGLLYGLTVHFKLYPIVYAVPFLVVLDQAFEGGSSKKKTSTFWQKLITRSRLEFSLISGGTFLLLAAWMALLYDLRVFFYETYFYHLIRQDHRHNFSVYFYQLYLTFGEKAGQLFAVAAFLPQWILLAAIGIAFGRDFFMACFLQTWIFVTFNKVCTSQYFLWYICLLPLVAPTFRISLKSIVAAIGAWFGAQLVWLYFAYRLEFMLENTFMQLWFAGLLLFIVNISLWLYCITNYKWVMAHDGVRDKSRHLFDDTNGQVVTLTSAKKKL